MSNNNKMKGLLKGLRYISQIFDNEKEPEMQIGYPTDVKHVAHIGWDGPSVNSPSWMNDFKSPPAFSSAPLNLNGDANPNDPNRSNGGVPNSPVRDLPDLPRSSRRSGGSGSGSGAGVVESPTREKSEKAKQRRSSKNSSSSRDATDSPRRSRRSSDSSLGIDSPARNLPEIPKKTRRKKSKESNSSSANTGGGGGSSRSNHKGPASPAADQFMAPFSDPGPGPGPDLVSKSKDSDLNRQKPVIDEAEEIKGLIT